VFNARVHGLKRVHLPADERVIRVRNGHDTAPVLEKSFLEEQPMTILFEEQEYVDHGVYGPRRPFAQKNDFIEKSIVGLIFVVLNVGERAQERSDQTAQGKGVHNSVRHGFTV